MNHSNKQFVAQIPLKQKVASSKQNVVFSKQFVTGNEQNVAFSQQFVAKNSILTFI